MKDKDGLKQRIDSILPDRQAESKPHKALLFLTLLQGIEDGKFTQNKFHYDDHLINLFTDIFIKFARPGDSNRPHNPFFHLRKNGFWHLVAHKGKEEALAEAKTVGGPGDIRNLVEYAYLDTDLYSLLQNRQNRQELIHYILDHLPSTQYDELRKHSDDLSQEEMLLSGVEDQDQQKANDTHHVVTMDEVNSTNGRLLNIVTPEQHAINTISNALDKHIELIPNYQVFDPRFNQYHECDLIAICQDRLAVIELKHWSGDIDICPHAWMINRKFYRDDPHISNGFKCKLLKSFYLKSFPALPGIWVESIVVLTNDEAIVHDSDSYKTDRHNPTFHGTATLIKHMNHRLGGLPSIPETKKLKSFQVKQVANFLREQLKLKPRQRLNIPGFEIVEDLTRSRQKLEFLIRPTERRLHTIKRARIFCPDLSAPPDVQRRQRAESLNSLGALERISDHPNILKVWQIPNDEGFVIEGSDWSQEGTLADLIRQKKRLSFDDTYPILHGILEGLGIIHEQSVIHRALRPENILISKGVPKLMNFDLSYYLEEDRVTVIPETSVLEPSPYMAPEVFRGDSLAEGADLFSVGVMLFEMLCGELPFKYSLDLEKCGGSLDDKALQKLEGNYVPELVRTLILELIQFDPAKRPQNALRLLIDLEQIRPGEAPVSLPSNRRLEPGEFHEQYEIESFLAEGREAQVYRARRRAKHTVALKIFNHEIDRERIDAEQASIERVKSPYVVHCKSDGIWSDKRMFLVLDLVEGRTLRSMIDSGDRPDLEMFKSVARCLFEVLDRMHNDPDYSEPLLHNDIKPDNVILNSENNPVLIDFCTACKPQIGAFMGTPGYIAPDLLHGIDIDFRESGDLFALGVTLYEWLCGCAPFDETPKLSSIPTAPDEILDVRPELSGWLLKVVQPLEEYRFKTIQEMRDAFECIFNPPTAPERLEEIQEELRLPRPRTDEEESGNPFVSYLNTLHNVTAENENALAEAQATNEFFGYIHVPLEVTEIIEQFLIAPDGGHVVLTGHAGDGKSTIGLELYKRLKGIPMAERLPVPLQEQEEIMTSEGRKVRMIKDMSELSEEHRIAAMKEVCNTDHQIERSLIITNTGTFLGTLEGLARNTGLNWIELENETLNLLESPNPGLLDGLSVPIKVVNLARIDNLATARILLQKIASAPYWEQCPECDLAGNCPIYLNISAVLERLEMIAERIEWIYRRLYEYGNRLTMRQIAGHLAYSITAGLDCRSVRNLAVQPIPPDLVDFLFFNRFFGFEGSLPEKQGERLTAVQYLLPLELGSKPYPSLDRRLWTNEGGVKPAIVSSLESVFGKLCQLIRLGPTSSGVPLGRLRQQVRRLLYLFADMTDDLEGFLSNFLESPMLVKMEAWQKDGQIENVVVKNDLKRRVLHVLQEQFTGMPLSEENGDMELYITLKRSDEELRQTVQVLLARVPKSGFSITIDPASTAMRSTRYILKLADRISGRQLAMELPFLDFVMLRGMGEIGQKIEPGYADRLESFKAELLDFESYRQMDGVQLLEFTNNGTFNVRKLIIGEKLQVIG
jgi:serine/threonine protein kinase